MSSKLIPVHVRVLSYSFLTPKELVTVISGLSKQDREKLLNNENLTQNIKIQVTYGEGYET